MLNDLSAKYIRMLNAKSNWICSIFLVELQPIKAHDVMENDVEPITSWAKSGLNLKKTRPTVPYCCTIIALNDNESSAEHRPELVYWLVYIIYYTCRCTMHIQRVDDYYHILMHRTHTHTECEYATHLFWWSCLYLHWQLSLEIICILHKCTQFCIAVFLLEN